MAGLNSFRTLLPRALALLVVSASLQAANAYWQHQDPLVDPDQYARACPDYRTFSMYRHAPVSSGPLKLPYQRPASPCRTFESESVEKVIEDLNEKLVDKDLARIFENAFPNTLDTTVRWHVDGTGPESSKRSTRWRRSTPWLDEAAWTGAQSFIVTGDINAEWLRDSTNQVAHYHPLAKKDKKLFNLILGAINTQAEFVIQSPYCNAFQPPPPSGLMPTPNGPSDFVHPQYEPGVVFECKYELDSLAAFLKLGNDFFESTGSAGFVGDRWLMALDNLMDVLDAQSKPTFDEETGSFIQNEYSFTRETRAGTETLGLSGLGNPLNSGTGLIRSAFRPSDDATILGFFIPANAMMSVELKRTGAMLVRSSHKKLGERLRERGDALEKAVWQHGVVTHKKYGQVFAYEVDGYGSQIIMDDANLPSLLSLPLLGFCDTANEIYQNTRRMILSRQGNPYFLSGSALSGVGGPHIGLQHAWPMSVLVQAMTSDDDVEILACIDAVKNVSRLALVNESVNVRNPRDTTRSWFAWANSVFAGVVLDLARRKPELVFGEGTEAYEIGKA